MLQVSEKKKKLLRCVTWFLLCHNLTYNWESHHLWHQHHSVWMLFPHSTLPVCLLCQLRKLSFKECTVRLYSDLSLANLKQNSEILLCFVAINNSILSIQSCTLIQPSALGHSHSFSHQISTPVTGKVNLTWSIQLELLKVYRTVSKLFKHQSP